MDELPPYYITPEGLEASVYLSHRWMARSLKRHLADVKEQAMYAVVHGGIDQPLRQLSIDYLTSLPFDGYCVGGSLGKNRDELVRAPSPCTHLPEFSRRLFIAVHLCQPDARPAFRRRTYPETLT